MNLQKRSCPVKIELHPSGIQFLLIIWEIGNDRHELWASSHVGGQFSCFVQALYGLFVEGDDQHNYFDRRGTSVTYLLPKEDSSLKEDEVAIQTSCEWDNEGEITKVIFRRIYHQKESLNQKEHDPVLVTITNEENEWIYTVESRDLCYATSKAYTDALKKYGFYGYVFSTGSQCFECGDCVDLHMLLFLKAYALDMEVPRKLSPAEGNSNNWTGPMSTDFYSELELLVFDM